MFAADNGRDNATLTVFVLFSVCRQDNSVSYDSQQQQQPFAVYDSVSVSI